MEIYGNIWITPYDEDLLVDALEHVSVPAEDCLDHQVVDTGLDSACVVTLIMMMMMTKMTMMMMIMSYQWVAGIDWGLGVTPAPCQDQPDKVYLVKCIL